MDKPAEGDVTPSSAAASVTAEMKQEIQKVVMGIFKEAVPRMMKQAIGEALPSALDQIAEAAIKEQPGDQPANGNPAASGDKLTLKALQEQIARLTQGIESRDKAITEERNRATAIRVRSDLHAQIARHVGADSPHLAPYVNYLLAQFMDKDGTTVRKVADEFGGEKFVSAQEAVDELFKGELRHLVQQSKANQLPPNGMLRPANGQVVPQHQGNGQQRANPLLMEIATGLQETRPEAAQILANDATRIQPATPRK